MTKNSQKIQSSQNGNQAVTAIDLNVDHLREIFAGHQIDVPPDVATLSLEPFDNRLNAVPVFPGVRDKYFQCGTLK